MTRHWRAAGLALALFASALYGQDKKRLFGLVRDASGAPVRGARVEISVVLELESRGESPLVVAQSLEMGRHHVARRASMGLPPRPPSSP